jgi:hypothetical protein
VLAHALSHELTLLHFPRREPCAFRYLAWLPPVKLVARSRRAGGSDSCGDTPRKHFDSERDAVRVGEVSQAEADGLKKGNKVTVVRVVTEATLTKRDRWVSTSAYSDVVDVLAPYCVTVVLTRK